MRGGKLIKYQRRFLKKNRVSQILKLRLKSNVFGCVALQNGNFTKDHIEALRRDVIHVVGRKAFFKFYGKRPFNVTKKGTGIRMGSGKSGVNHVIFKIRKGDLIFEVGAFSRVNQYKILRTFQSKLPIKVKGIFLI